MLPVETSSAVPLPGASVSVPPIRAAPATSSFAVGSVVPMPTSPLAVTHRSSESGWSCPSVGIVDADPRQIKANGIFSARHLGVPDAGVDHLEFTIDVNFLELVDQDHRRIAVDRNVARGHLDFERLGLAVAQALHDIARFCAALFNVGGVAG